MYGKHIICLDKLSLEIKSFEFLKIKLIRTVKSISGLNLFKISLLINLSRLTLNFLSTTKANVHGTKLQLLPIF